MIHAESASRVVIKILKKSPGVHLIVLDLQSFLIRRLAGCRAGNLLLGIGAGSFFANCEQQVVRPATRFLFNRAGGAGKIASCSYRPPGYRNGLWYAAVFRCRPTGWKEAGNRG